jgi:hypothetical protein
VHSARTLARGALYPAYRALDLEPAALRRTAASPCTRACARCGRAWPSSAILNASRPYAVGGQQIPRSVAIVAEAYLMAGNAAAYGYAGLTTGAAHFIEAFGDDWLRDAVHDAACTPASGPAPWR